jgi:hypothetical protein
MLRQQDWGWDMWLDLFKKGVIWFIGANPMTREALVKVFKTHKMAFSGE